MPKCENPLCKMEVPRLYARTRSDGVRILLCWRCYSQYYKDEYNRLKEGQRDIRGFDKKYDDIPKLVLDGEGVRREENG